MSAPLPPVVADLVDDGPVVADVVPDAPTALPVATPVPKQRPKPEAQEEAVAVAEPVSPVGTFGLVGRVAEWCFGVASLFVGLAVLAAVPVGQFLALGY